ncbi:GtrA family protein [Arthrobacter sp. UYEF20]|uniref:GtrA family protein n=1 Tax=Arthrobacter sp. UYEF20 TaxID=1756363 RepID=UPI0033993A46
MKFLVVGVASFAIDLGLLALMHQVGGVDLWIATPIAFLASLVFNFFIQRKFTFQSNSRAQLSFLKYGTLVVFNLVATDLVVNLIAASGHSYAIGKVAATVATTSWNFLLYKHWIFKPANAGAGHVDLTPTGILGPVPSPEDQDSPPDQGAPPE